MDSCLQRLRESVEAAVRSASAEELSRRAEGKWCAGEVLEHLLLTYTGTVKGFQRCLEAQAPLATSSTWRHRLLTALVVGVGYMPSGREAPKSARPRGAAIENVLAEIGPQIGAMDEVIGKCEQRYGRNTKVLDHPILGPLTAQQWRKFHWVHGQHHLKQIRRLREHAA